MRNFHIPFDMHTEDKIIGGYLSIRQLAWLVAGIGVAVVLFGMDQSYMTSTGVNIISVTIRVIISLIAIGVALFLAFGVLDEMEADKYLFKKILFETKPKIIKYTDRK